MQNVMICPLFLSTTNTFILAICDDGQVRLVSNSLQYRYGRLGSLEEDGYVRVVALHEDQRGRLDVCFNQRWGTVHIFEEGLETRHDIAEVACRQLGFSPTCT